MSQQLHPDCLNQIFGYYYDDSMTIFQQIEDQKNLRSCLLVNRLWCEASVRILWRTIQNYQTLVACLPNESKEILHRNGIIISTPTSKSPLFHYVAFVKGVSMGEVYRKINKLTASDNHKNFIIIQEIFKMLMNQISLKGLDMIVDSFHFQTLPFTTYPGTMDCLRNLSELICNSNVDPEFFHQVSRVCHHLRSLRTVIKNVISDGLTELISNQRNLKSFSLTNYLVGGNWAEMIPSITKLSKSLTKLYIFEGRHHTPLSFIEGFTNLRELELSIFFNVDEYFKTLQHVTLPRLQVLKFNEKSPNHECFIKFLETNGKNLQEIRLCYGDNLSNLAIAKFCPNLKSLRTRFKNHEVETLKVTLSRCQQLESIRVVCGAGYLNENRLLRIVTKYSPKPFHELIIHLYGANQPELFSKDLEPVFLSWSNRVPRKSLSLIIAGTNNCTNNTVAVKKESMKVIEKFKKLGIIKRFEIK